MKKIVVLLMMACTLCATAIAQTVTKKVDKTKRTSTLPQKVHNTFSKHKTLQRVQNQACEKSGKG